MKQFLHFLLLLTGYTALAQMAQPSEKLVAVGTIANGKTEITVDKAGLVQYINHNLFDDKAVIDNVIIENAITFGDRRESFYYLSYTSTKDGTQVVRYLVKKGDTIYTEDTAEIGFKDFYVSCKGVASCFPHIVISEGKHKWSCGEKLVCPSPEEAAKNPCALITSLVLPDEE
jgi:hypothetical protein